MRTENPYGSPWAGSGNEDRHRADRWRRGYVAGLTRPRQDEGEVGGVHDPTEEQLEGFRAALRDLEQAGVGDYYARQIESREANPDATYMLLQELRADDRLTRMQKRHVGWFIPGILCCHTGEGRWTPPPEEEERVLRRLLIPPPVSTDTPGDRLLAFQDRIEGWQEDGVEDDDLMAWLSDRIRSKGGGSGSVFSLHRAYKGGADPEVWVASWSWTRGANGRLKGKGLVEAVRRTFDLPTPAEAAQGDLFEGAA